MTTRNNRCSRNRPEGAEVHCAICKNTRGSARAAATRIMDAWRLSPSNPNNLISVFNAVKVARAVLRETKPKVKNTRKRRWKHIDILDLNPGLGGFYIR